MEVNRSTWARRATRHTSPEIQWSCCDGCPSLYAKPPDPRLERLGRGKWEYYCDKMGRFVARKEIYTMEKDCPIGRKAGRR